MSFLVQVIYEDEDLVAVNKPAGLLVHHVTTQKKGQGTQEEALTDWFLRRYPKVKNVGDDPATRPGIVHRLDKGTSGIMVVAKNQKSFSYLKRLFGAREIKKTYYALAVGHFEKASGLIEAPIGFQKNGTLKRTTRDPKDAKEAMTEYRVLEPFKDVALLEIHPRTGRTHQIRVHLASIGHPIVGDVLYGGNMQSDRAPRTMLHAASLEFTDMHGKRLKLEATTPEDFQKIIHKLRHSPEHDMV